MRIFGSCLIVVHLFLNANLFAQPCTPLAPPDIFDSVFGYFPNAPFRITISRDRHEAAEAFWKSIEKDIKSRGYDAKIPWTSIAYYKQQGQFDLGKTRSLSSAYGQICDSNKMFEFFYMLSLFKAGRESLELFFPYYAAGNIDFCVTSFGLVSDKQGNLIESPLLGGFRVYDKMIGLAAKNMRLLDILMMLSHEGVHAGDTLSTGNGLVSRQLNFLSKQEKELGILDPSSVLDELSKYYHLSSEHRGYRNSHNLAQEIIDVAIDPPPTILTKSASWDENKIRRHLEVYQFPDSVVKEYWKRHSWNEPAEQLWKDDPPQSILPLK